MAYIYYPAGGWKLAQQLRAVGPSPLFQIAKLSRILEYAISLSWLYRFSQY